VCCAPRHQRTMAGKKAALLFGSWDSTLSLMAAFFVNAAILIVAATAFYYNTNNRQVGPGGKHRRCASQKNAFEALTKDRQTDRQSPRSSTDWYAGRALA
jgi:Natural resistance-associated macrophage protein